MKIVGSTIRSKLYWDAYFTTPNFADDRRYSISPNQSSLISFFESLPPFKKTPLIFLSFDNRDLPTPFYYGICWDFWTFFSGNEKHLPTTQPVCIEVDDDFPKLLVRGVMTCFLVPWGTWRIIPGLGYVVNNDGDPFRPQDLGFWDLFQMAFTFMAYKLGWSCLTIPGMILQVESATRFPTLCPSFGQNPPLPVEQWNVWAPWLFSFFFFRGWHQSYPFI